MTTINCDLDGVLVDFERGFQLVYGEHPHAVEEPVMWAAIEENANHWIDLPAMPGALQLWAYIVPFKPRIITGCPSTGYNAAAAGKKAWCARELGEHVEVITTPSKYKQKYILAPGDILIDDMDKNLKRWTDAGGVAVKHTDASQTIRLLKELGF